MGPEWPAGLGLVSATINSGIEPRFRLGSGRVQRGFEGWSLVGFGRPRVGTGGRALRSLQGAASAIEVLQPFPGELLMLPSV